MRAANILFIAVLLIPQASRSAEETIFRSGDEVVVRIPELDRLRQEHRQLKATVRLAGDGGLRTFALNLSDASVPPAIVVDVAGYGNCTGVLLEVQNEAGKLVYSRRVVPLPVIKITSVLPQQDRLAAIEPGTALRPVGSNTANQNNANAPKIPLPDFTRLRQEKLAVPQRSVTASEITYSVVTSMDLPVPASANYVIVSRQSFAPDDATACSLYFSYRKALYDEVSTRVTGYRKFLVEVPLDRAWLKQSGDAAVTLPLSAFAVHAADERSSEGTNMLGGSDTGLAQGGQSVDIDDQGRIYFSNVSDGAGLVRFNPHTQRFEQPPVNFDQECRKLIPAEGSWVRSWDTAVGELLCTRGRVYIAYSRNYRVHTPNGHFETCSGVVSVPQAHWDDAAAFAADIRLHAACWAGAEHRIYSDNVPVAEYSRKLVAPMATDRGIFLNTTPDCRGGPWRLDLDEHGNTQRLAEVKSLKDANSTDGAALPPAQLVTDRGLPKQRMINVGGAGRQFLKFAYGEFEISRAALALTLPGAPEEELVDQSGRFRTAYPGAPQGTLTVRFDVAAKIKAEFQRYPQLTAALSGISLGPNYCVTPIPGELDRAIGVCEYGYYFSKLDFSRRATERKVFKDFLPAQSGGEPTTLPTQVGLGPYNAAWVEHDDAQWLYIPGYTGIARLKYAEQGQTLKAFKPEMIHTRLLPQPIDGRGRDNVKDFLHVLPAIGGQLIDIGRGRPGRGGGAFSAGLELFDPRTLGKSQSAVYMNRCYGLYSPVSRLVLSTATATERQEIFVASGPIRQEYLDDITDETERPVNRDPKIFVYDCQSGGQLRDLYGFALPALSGGSASSSHIGFSPCRQFLVVLQHSGSLATFSVAQRRFIDALELRNAGDERVHPIEFDRPSAGLWEAPSGQLFFLAAIDGRQSKRVCFYEAVVASDGSLSIRPHLKIDCDGGATVKDFSGIVRCFLPDLTKRDGSYNFVLGGDQGIGQTTVRVIDDFIPPRASAAGGTPAN